VGPIGDFRDHHENRKWRAKGQGGLDASGDCATRTAVTVRTAETKFKLRLRIYDIFCIRFNNLSEPSYVHVLTAMSPSGHYWQNVRA
jgi:hypothetical protein